MTLIMRTVTYYLRCRACKLRSESEFRNSKCPFCHAETQVYGIKEETPGEPGASSDTAVPF